MDTQVQKCAHRGARLPFTARRFLHRCHCSEVFTAKLNFAFGVYLVRGRLGIHSETHQQRNRKGSTCFSPVAGRFRFTPVLEVLILGTVNVFR
jgi:hypothetical protein